MRTICIILGGLAAILGFFLSFILDDFAYIPVIAGLIFGTIALVLSRKKGIRDSIPKLIIALSFLAGAITTMNLFKENKVADDVKQTQEELKKQEKKDIEEIENLENELEDLEGVE